MHRETGRLARMDEVEPGERGDYQRLNPHLSRKAERALAEGRRYPDPAQDRALYALHQRLRVQRERARKARQRREKQARKRNRGSR